jgi:hypothetical protein
MCSMCAFLLGFKFYKKKVERNKAHGIRLPVGVFFELCFLFLNRLSLRPLLVCFPGTTNMEETLDPTLVWLQEKFTLGDDGIVQLVQKHPA